MKLIELLSSDKPTLSCELFPPKPGAALLDAPALVRRIAALHPAYISVTCSAGGSGNGGNNGSQQAPAREQNHSPKPSTRAARAQRRAAEEDPGLELITRRPPKQKFANFEEYLAAHGGMTVPLPEEETAPVNDGAAQ